MSSEGFAQMTSPAPEDVFGVWHETLLRVRYAETDKMGIVYYANYLVWFEIGRTDYCRARGFSYRDMEENEDAFLVVAEAYCRYKAAAYYDDELIDLDTKLCALRMDKLLLKVKRDTSSLIQMAAFVLFLKDTRKDCLLLL
jgi:YbgC/YbaW family acyl-CoA thioester hydrolase